MKREARLNSAAALVVICFLALMLAVAVQSFGMGAIREWVAEQQGTEETQGTPVTNVAPVPPAVPAPAPTPAPVSSEPFDWSKAKYHRIAKDVGAWKQTATITEARFRGDLLITKGSFPKWPCVTMGDASIQGCFALAVEQHDGSIVVGTWDWDRCGHQGSKTTDNLRHGSEHAFFNLRPGSRCWVFVTGLSRDNKRNAKERSNLYELRWE